MGKSRLIEEFSDQFPRFLCFEGLAPQPGIGQTGQLAHFAESLSRQSELPALSLRSWQEAFTLLANEVKRGKVLILLDEISWMASGNRNFAGILKAAWDTQLKRNANVALVLCGSVSSWIKNNILENAGFVGRISHDLVLEQLPLEVCPAFWGKRAARISSAEIFRVLAVTGGVPRYLEEIRPSESAEKNIKRLCFSPTGLLFNEFDRIFDDVFQRRSPAYKTIVRSLVSGPRTFSEICKATKVDPNGVVTGYLSDLCKSGFLAQDHSYSMKTGKRGRFSKYRIRDNYLRFYLKYVLPHRAKIAKGIYRGVELERLPHYETIMGFQLETLVLNQLPSIIERLGIAPEGILSAAPHSQRQKSRQKGCQVDILIHTRHAIFICEIKFRKQIGASVIREVGEKIDRLKIPQTTTVRPVLIHMGKLTHGVTESEFFDKLIDFADLLH